MCQSLRKEFKTKVAVDNISFNVQAGEVVGLLGPNGAGKTTTINMILGLLRPTTGTISIDGRDVARERSRALEPTNCAAANTPLPGNLTVIQNLRVFGLFYQVPQLTRRVEELLDEFSLRPLSKVKCGVLSSGEQTRLSLAKALLNRPHLLLLDEPSASLDPAMAQKIRQHIMDYVQRERVAVLWASHNMYEVESVCHQVLFLSRGKILLAGNPRTFYCPGQPWP
jgi:ABC-2 type transport system ATP-binding protein